MFALPLSSSFQVRKQPGQVPDTVGALQRSLQREVRQEHLHLSLPPGKEFGHHIK
jgi:hypothetical protein